MALEERQLYLVDRPSVDPETGEVLEARIDDLSDDALLTYITELKDTLSSIRTELSAAESEMIRRMEERKATAYKSAEYEVKLVPQRSYEYNLPKLLKLKDLVDEDTFNQAIKIEYKPNKTQLNKLLKFGGPIREIIESSVREVPKPPRLSIKRRQN